jgi:hypothetical protein
MTQTQAVLALLRERGEDGLTPLEALSIIGSFRLAARIADAKQLLDPDEDIVTLRATLPNGKTVARYVLRRKVIRSGQLTLWEER